jgi:hypothetical protein
MRRTTSKQPPPLLEEAAPPKALSRNNSERSIGRDAQTMTPRPALLPAKPPAAVKSKPTATPSAPAEPAPSREVSEKAEGSEEKLDKNSKEYIREKTKGYVVVTDFTQVHPGDHIRYQGINGKFHGGGFIWYKKVNEENGRTFWMVGQSRKSDMANIKHFPLYWDKVRIVWRKLDQDTELLRKSIDAKQYLINDIALFLLKKHGEEFKNWMNSREEERRKKVNP